MYLILSDGNGNRHEGVLLAGDLDRMRVAFRGGRDVVELTRREEGWAGDDCGPVEVESIVVGGRAPEALEMPARYMTAG